MLYAHPNLLSGKQIPINMPVSVLSVLGSFRTGKSFLLTFMLKYLQHFDEGSEYMGPPSSPHALPFGC